MSINEKKQVNFKRQKYLVTTCFLILILSLNFPMLLNAKSGSSSILESYFTAENPPEREVPDKISLILAMDSREITLPDSSRAQGVSDLKSPLKCGLFSLIVPGVGEIFQKANKSGIVFLALETSFWGGYLFFNNKGDDKLTESKDYGQKNAGAYRNGSDKYFEDVGNYIGSGFYVESDPDSLVLYTDAKYHGTYNQNRWYMIFDVYKDPQDPEKWTYDYNDIPEENKAKAWNDYKREAYKGAYLWDWVDGKTMEQAIRLMNEYMGLRDDSNKAYKKATFSLGLVLFNHLASAIHSSKAAMNFNKKLEQETGLSLEFSVDPLPGNPGTRLQVVRKFN